MLSVSEQLHQYRALKANPSAKLSVQHPCIIPYLHPNTKEYFQALMKRWHKNDNQSTSANK